MADITLRVLADRFLSSAVEVVALYLSSYKSRGTALALDDRQTPLRGGENEATYQATLECDQKEKRGGYRG